MVWGFLDACAALLFGVALTSLGLVLFNHHAVRVTRRRPRPRQPGPDALVSILKPVKGLDDGLYENLASLACQSYQHFEILIGAEDPDDPALRVARQVQRDFPDAAIRVLSGLRRLGLNPKVSNLVALSTHARHEFLLVSDSNVRVAPGYLRAMLDEFADPRVGLVSSILCAEGAENLGACLDQLHMNTFVASAVCGADVLLSHPCVIGKSMLFRRADLERVGGFSSVANVLAEDYVLGQRFLRAGCKVALSPHVVRTFAVRRSLREFLERHVRWNQMRRSIHPWLYLGEPLLNPIPGLLCLWLAAGLGASVGPLSSALLAQAAALGILTKIASDTLLARRLSGVWPHLAHVLCIPIKDIAVLFAWGLGGFKRTVRWRGNRMGIGPGSALYPITGRRARSMEHAVEPA